MKRNGGLLPALSTVLLALLVALFTAACGGSGAGLPDSSGGTITPGASDARALPVGANLPDMPRDLGVASGHNTSAIGEQSYTGSGSALLNYAGGVVDGDSLVLTSTADEMAWAFYRADGLRDLYVTTLGVMTVPGTPDTTWYAAISDFTMGAWEWIIETKLPEADFDLTQIPDRTVSPLGNLYWVVLVPAGGYTVEIQQSKLLVDDYNGGWRPGEGNYLFASMGLPGWVDLQWGWIDGMASYEVYRRDAGDPAGMRPDGDFTLIATTAEPCYQDYDVLVGVPYEYRVRAVNEEGPGAFSEVAVGWAGDPNIGPDPCDASARGTVESITEDSLVLLVTGIWPEDFGVGETWEYALNADTMFLDNMGQPVAWDYMQPGLDVFVNGVYAEDGTRQALAVMENMPPPYPPAYLSFLGQVVSVSERELVITDERGEPLTFTYDEATQWIDADGASLTPADFAEGEWVCVNTDPALNEMNAVMVMKLGDPSDPPVDPGDPGDPPAR